MTMTANTSHRHKWTNLTVESNTNNPDFVWVREDCDCGQIRETLDNVTSTTRADGEPMTVTGLCSLERTNSKTDRARYDAAIADREVSKDAEKSDVVGESEVELATKVTFKKAKDRLNRPLTRVWADDVRVATIRRDRVANVRVTYSDRTRLSYTAWSVADARELLEREFSQPTAKEYQQ